MITSGTTTSPISIQLRGCGRSGVLLMRRLLKYSNHKKAGQKIVSDIINKEIGLIFINKTEEELPSPLSYHARGKNAPKTDHFTKSEFLSINSGNFCKYSSSLITAHVSPQHHKPPARWRGSPHPDKSRVRLNLFSSPQTLSCLFRPLHIALARFRVPIFREC